MKQNLITDVVQAMLPFLNNAQTERLQEVLQHTLFGYEVTKIESEKEISEQNYMELFISAKRIEGCSEKSLKYYKATIEMMIATVGKSVKHIETDDIRRYLTEYQEKKKSSKVTIDNIRRILSSFFSWLEDEDYILKSPVRRIHKVKTGTNIKETYSDEALELMRDNCTEPRDLAMIDMLASTPIQQLSVEYSFGSCKEIEACQLVTVIAEFAAIYGNKNKNIDKSYGSPGGYDGEVIETMEDLFLLALFEIYTNCVL